MTEDLLIDDFIFTIGVDGAAQSDKIEKVEKIYKEFRTNSQTEVKDEFSFDTGGDDFSWG